MSLERAFSQKRSIIPYFTLGDPDLSYTESLIRASIEAGADCIEIGIPFSDPIADGPVIQASHHRALSNAPDIGLKEAFALSTALKKDYDTPIIYMAASNLIHHYGIDAAFKDAKAAGCDALVIPDLIIESAQPFQEAASQQQLPLIPFISPLTPEQRIKSILKNAEGFIYLISSTGTTGVRQGSYTNLKAVASSIKKYSQLPIAVGFGVSTKSQVKDLHRIADAAIIGSAFVKEIEENPKAALTKIPDLISSFKAS